MALWHWHQGLILLLDRDPHSWLQYNSGQHKYDLTDNARLIPSDLRAEYERSFEVMRTYRDAAWSLEFMPPSHYVEWAKGIGAPVPPELVKELELLGNTIVDWKTRNERLLAVIAELNHRLPGSVTGQTSRAIVEIGADAGLRNNERNSLMKMLIAMAMARYGFVPGAKRNIATAKICEDVRTLGLDIDEATVLEWLRKASALLPKDGL